MCTQNNFSKMRFHAVILGFLLLQTDSVFAAEVTAPALNVTAETLDVSLNTSLYLKCTGSSPLVWQFEDPVTNDKRSLNSLSKSASSSSGSNPVVESVVRLDFKSYEDTGRYICVSNANARSKSASIYIFVNDLEHLLLPIGGEFFEILQAIEAQPHRIQCLVTNSQNNVTLWKGKCGEELVSQDGVSYDPTKGFLIAHLTNYFRGRFCCKAQLDEQEAEFTFVHDFVQQTQVIPQVYIDASEAKYVVVNSSFSLTCIIMVEPGTMIEIVWSYPPAVAAERIRIGEELPDHSRDQNVLNAYIRKLTVENVQMEDGGTYQCNVTDHSYKENYIEVFVPVYEHRQPSVVTFRNLTTDVFPLAKEVGESMIFEVGYSVFPPSEVVNLDWTKNGVPISNRSGKYEVSHTSETATLLVRKLARDDSGTYTLLGTTPEETRSFSIEFKVKDKPQISILSSERCCYMAGENYQLRCVAESFPIPNATWMWKPSPCETKCDAVEIFKPENELSKYTNAVNLTETIQGDNDTIILSLFVTAEASGEYSCKSSNEMGTTEANVPFIVTDIKDGFGISSETLRPVESYSFSLNCSASKLLYEKVEMNWTLSSGNSSAIPLENIVSSSESQYSKILKLEIDVIKPEHSGVYECFGFYNDQSLGMNRKSVSVDVRALEKPYVNETNMNSLDMVASPDAEFELFCYVNGVPKPTVSWHRDGIPLNANMSGVKFADGFQKLIISRIVAEDSGFYECRAENKVGVASLNTTLTVIRDLPLAVPTPMDSKQIAVFSVVGIGVLSTLILLFLLGRRLQRHKRRQKQLRLFNHKVFQEGQISLFNPDLPLDDQAELLPYDARWEFPKERLKLGKTLGQGAFGRVVKAEAIELNDYETSTTVAVKMLKERADANQQKALMAELKILIHLGHHVNIVNLLGAITKNIPNGELMVMVEYCRYGNLRHYLLRYRDKFIAQEDFGTEKIEYATRHLYSSSPSHSGASDADRCRSPSLSVTPTSPGSSVENRSYEFFKNFGSTSANTAGSSISDSSRVYFRVDSKEHCITTVDLICFAFQCARGMDYLASRKLIHRDLAARNVLLANDNIVKICDFGLAKDCYKYSNYIKKGDGPLPVKWMAIESLGHKVFTTKSDVWSFGVLLWEFFTLGGNPYPGAQVDEDFYRRLKQGYRMGKPEFAPDVIYQIMRDCWKSDPVHRPDFQQLASALGELLESGIKQHYIDLNEPYMEMNEQILDHSYLNVTKKEAKSPGSDYVNTEISSRSDGYDDVPPIRYSMDEAIPKSPMEVVPMIHFGCDEEITKSPQYETTSVNNARASSTDYLCMGNRPLSEDDDSVFVDITKVPTASDLRA